MNPDGSFVYDADDGYDGPDGFEYRAFDGVAYTDVMFVSIVDTFTLRTLGTGVTEVLQGYSLLDNSYPYSAGSVAEDSPFLWLPVDWLRAERHDSFQMYFLFKSARARSEYVAVWRVDWYLDFYITNTTPGVLDGWHFDTPTSRDIGVTWSGGIYDVPEWIGNVVALEPDEAWQIYD